jgi:alpha-1,2-mannosyltransferase
MRAKDDPHPGSPPEAGRGRKTETPWWERGESGDKMISSTSDPGEPLARWERFGLWLLLPVIVAFGVFVEVRSCFLKRRMGDLGVYLRAAWAARQGGDRLYSVICDNGWHYCYPPLLAILMIPLADAPAGEPPPWAPSYETSVILWFGFSILCLAVGLHVLASALEETSPDGEAGGPPPGSRRWWALRMLPCLACLPPVAGSLVRGQVTLLLLALLCAFVAALVRGRRWTAGMWLAGAICLKIIPVFLLLVPLVRRDGRCLIGCALGLLLGLAVVPALTFGPSRTVACYQELYAVMLAPGVGVGSDTSRARELINVTATDSQSFLAVIHNTLHLKRQTRPRAASPTVRAIHWLLGAGMTLASLWTFRRRSRENRQTVLLAGVLIINMILLSPVCHLHYFALSMPLIMGLLAPSVRRSVYPGPLLALVLVAGVAAGALPSLPRLRVLRDTGLALYGALLLWAVACLTLWHPARRRRVACSGETGRRGREPRSPERPEVFAGHKI